MPDSRLQAADTSLSQTSGDGADRYTGVILIHGIGDIKRNSTLEQAVNTLAYWFNREAGLALRREGRERIWLRAEFTDDPNPDAPAARATIDLAAPADEGASLSGDQSASDALRLEFHEVWWAESFGLPAVRATLQWAQIQFREQAAHLLVPFGFRLGPAHTAASAPAREISQALTFRPPQDSAKESQADDVSGASSSPLNQLERMTLRGILAVYSVFQYVWKALQWLILTPLIYFLLLLMGPLRLLALIPPLRSTVIAGLSSILDYIMLHWIAPAQVYTLDYARSAGIRERFERELETFLTDKRCDRIVVIAHSMGTVVAYEGLTTTLSRFGERASDKPITFICLAQALRRVWLLTAADPHRLRETLPDGVRWLHFWARYDPVATGPVRADSLPMSLSGPDPYAELRARLDTCENVDVVNTDSSFADHDTYWDNMEQVVGPIARELVAGHPALESLVRQRLAKADDLLRRRWRVAWRAFIAVAGGLAAGFALFRWDWDNGWPVGQRVAAILSNGAIGRLAGTLCPPCVEIFNDLKTPSQAVSGAAPGGTAPTASAPELSYAVVAFGVAAILALVGIPLIGKLIAQPSPTAFRDTSETAVRRWGVIALATVALILLALTEVVPTLAPALTPASTGGTVLYYLLLAGVSLASSLALAVWIVIVIDAALRRRWGWFAMMLLLAVPAFTIVAGYVIQALPTGIVQLLNPSYNRDEVTKRLQGLTTSLPSQLYVNIPGDALFIAGTLTLVGLIFLLIELARRQRRWFVGLLVAAPVFAFMFAVLDIVLTIERGDVSGFTPLPIVPAALAIALLYGMWSSPASRPAKPTGTAVALNRALLVLSSASLALLLLDDAQSCDQFAYSQCFIARDVSVVAWLGGLLAVAAGILLLITAAWRRQWVWVVAIPLLLLTLAYRWGYEESAILSHFADPATHVVLQNVLYTAIVFHGLWLAILTACFAYVFWARFHETATGEMARGPNARSGRSLPSGVVTASIATVSVAILLAVLFSLFPPVPVNAQLAERLKAQPHPLPLQETLFPSLDSIPASLAADPEGGIWFTEPGGNRIGKITSKGEIIDDVRTLAPNSYPDAIIFASNKVWFTEPQTGKIVAFNPSSGSSQDDQVYKIGDQKGYPSAITQGPDNAIWCTEFNSDHIARIGSDGSVTELPQVPSHASGLVAITRGPDNNIWFVERAANKVGRVIPATNTIKEFPLPTRDSSPTAIMAGQDGNLWFTESRAGNIGRIKPIGDDSAIQRSIQEFPVGAHPGDITQGPGDGYLWFTDVTGNQVGRIRPADDDLAIQSSILKWPMPHEHVSPARIITDGLSGLWFTELNRNRVGHWQSTSS